MFKSRRKQLEEEAKKDPNYRPTKELEVDTTGLSEDEKPHNEIPWLGIIIFGAIAILMAICIVIICVFGGPVKNA